MEQAAAADARQPRGGRRPAPLSALPDGYVDQVARWERFKAVRPDAEKAHRAPVWTGSVIVCRKRREVSRAGLGPLIDALERLAGMDAEAMAIERDYRGWRVWLSSLDRWWAVRQGQDGVWSQGRHDPITVSADSAAGLREQLDGARALAGAS